MAKPIFTVGEDTAIEEELVYFDQQSIRVRSERGVHDIYNVKARTPYPLGKSVLVSQLAEDGTDIVYECKVTSAIPRHFSSDKMDMLYVLAIMEVYDVN